jgi:hypothetical protein
MKYRVELEPDKYSSEDAWIASAFTPWYRGGRYVCLEVGKTQDEAVERLTRTLRKIEGLQPQAKELWIEVT